MRLILYNALVNRVSGIAYRYHQYHDGSHGLQKVLSWGYVLVLNFGYYVLCLRFLGRKPDAEFYESHKLPVTGSESQLDAARNPRRTVKDYIEVLSKYDVISFDVFDTLVFRPFDLPTDLFYFLDEPMGILDFHRIRIEMERKARIDRFKVKGNYEINLQDIWQKIEKEVGSNSVDGRKIEQDLEFRFCYANPFMLSVFQELQKLGKRIIITTDMYLPGDFIRQLLEHCGYIGFDRLYVSNAYEKSKAEGNLYDVIRQDLGKSLNIIHVGDNEHSDVHMAKKHGMDALLYPNVNKYSLTYRSHDMSAIVGSAYRGIVNTHLYSGMNSYSMEYEYGFIYGGLFVLGYCAFIHEYCQKNNIDMLLFLARDGDILKQVYDLMYPGEDTHYVLWGRYPSVKLMADANRYDYFRRMLWHKVGEKKTVKELLNEAGLMSLTEKKALKGILTLDSVITSDNCHELKDWLQLNWEAVLDCYREESAVTKTIFTDLLAGCQNTAAVDIGWAGSGAVSLSYLVERIWKLPCYITGIVAGTNTIYNAEPNASEAMLQNGRLVSYLYSQRENRDLLKKHDLNRDYNVYWELLLGSPTRQFLGYTMDQDGKAVAKFGKADANQDGILEIQRGILDFARIYQEHFGDRPEMFCISGRDAYAPMLVAASQAERYLKAINQKFHLDTSVGNI